MTEKKTVGRPRKSNRPKRAPISGNRDVLTVRGIPEGYVARWVNDVDERVSKFQAAGYEFVNDKGVITGDKTINNGDNVGSVITKNVGGGVVSYLMAQRKEYYEEDKATAAQAIDDTEAAITRKKEGQYGSIEVKRK